MNSKPTSPPPPPPPTDPDAVAAATRKRELASAHGKNGAHKKGLSR